MFESPLGFGFFFVSSNLELSWWQASFLWYGIDEAMIDLQAVMHYGESIKAIGNEVMLSKDAIWYSCYMQLAWPPHEAYFRPVQHTQMYSEKVHPSHGAQCRSRCMLDRASCPKSILCRNSEMAS